MMALASPRSDSWCQAHTAPAPRAHTARSAAPVGLSGTGPDEAFPAAEVTLAEYLGHSGPGFTLRVYCHLMPGAPDKVRQAIDRALGEDPDCPSIAQEGENGR